MDKTIVVNKVKNIISKIVGLDINENTSPEEINGWDSLNHLNIILSIEEEFDLAIPPEDFPKFYNSPAEIADYLVDHLNKRG